MSDLCKNGPLVSNAPSIHRLTPFGDFARLLRNRFIREEVARQSALLSQYENGLQNVTSSKPQYSPVDDLKAACTGAIVGGAVGLLCDPVMGLGPLAGSVTGILTGSQSYREDLKKKESEVQKSMDAHSDAAARTEAALRQLTEDMARNSSFLPRNPRAFASNNVSGLGSLEAFLRSSPQVSFPQKLLASSKTCVV